MKNTINKKIEKILLGFASGVMIAASVWSLLIPSIEMAKNQNILGWIPAIIGFIMGVTFLLGLDIIHSRLSRKERKDSKTKIKRSVVMALAVTLHNIPEGMTVRDGICRSTC